MRRERIRATELKTLGNDALAKGDLVSAEKLYREAITVDADFAEAYNNLGLVLDRAERFGEALECYLKSIELKPDLASGYLNLGNWHRAHGNIEDQVRHYEKAIALNPAFHEAYNNLGLALLHQGKKNEAIKYFEQALSIKQDFLAALCNLGVAYREDANKQKAIAVFRQVLAIDPEHWEAHHQLGYVLSRVGDLDEAEQHLRTAIAIKPDYAVARVDLGMFQLGRGNYAEGLRLYESRFDFYRATDPHYDADYFTNASRAPAWSGQNLTGRTLLVWMEQGFGDNLMMMRFLPQLMTKGLSRLVVLSRVPLAPIFAHLPYPVEAITSEAELRGGMYDYHVALTSLPYLFGIELDSIPREVPYIFVPDDMTQRWKSRLNATAGMKVGLVWAGNSKMGRDSLRSLPFDAFAPLSEVRSIDFYSLQKGERSKEACDAEWLNHDCIAECSHFLDTAALMENLDLVISADTATAHLAGALGKPVWLLNRFESEWRWMHGREDSVWYPSMRIFTQPELNDWASVIDKVKQELISMAALQDLSKYEAMPN